MNLSCEFVLSELESIRLRQIPWHKKPTVFNTLSSLGLVEVAQQRNAVSSSRPSTRIVVLTKLGLTELIRLKSRSHENSWRTMRVSVYALQKSDSGPG